MKTPSVSLLLQYAVHLFLSEVCYYHNDQPWDALLHQHIISTTVQNFTGSRLHKMFLHNTELDWSLCTAVLQLAAFTSSISCKSFTCFLALVKCDMIPYSLVLRKSCTNKLPMNFVLSSNQIIIKKQFSCISQ